MNKKLKIVLIALVILGLTAFIGWQYVHQETDDVSRQEPSARFSVEELLEKTNSDTTGLNQLKDQLIVVTGPIRRIQREAADITIELGDTNAMASITCQMDQRHLEGTETLQPGAHIRIKGKLSGFTIDTDLGLGNTIEMNFCNLESKQ